MTFTSVFPGCYRGRWPHQHVEVYEDVDGALGSAAAIKTSQIALPETVCEQVYTDSRYGDSSRNLGQLSLTTDNVFRDGWEHQLATVTGSNDGGYSINLLVRI